MVDSQTRILMRYANLADLIIASYPVVTSSSNLAWNTTFWMGNVTPTLSLPSISSTDFDQEIRVIFTASSANASFTAPADAYLADEDGFSGLSTGNTIAITNLVSGSIYEVSFSVISATQITMILKEWTTA